ncbi:MAG: hypothetical protein FJ125_05840 [Deltaproteobacteria bacterium]|nr:hypothetical protein [Deltaproteobacteria bacterium]
MPRAPQRAAAPLLGHDDGLHLSGTVLWFDSPRQRDLCFISHAAAMARPLAHRKVLASAPTFRLLQECTTEAQRLPSPFFRPFCLGELELELLPAGFLPGSAQLLVGWRKTRILYAADIAMHPARAAEAIRIHRCDLLIMSCTLGDPELHLPPRRALEEELLSFVRQSLALGRSPVLLADRLGLAQELLQLLDEAGIPVRSHRAIARHAAAYVELGHPLPVASFLGPARPEQPPAALIWPLELHASPTLARLQPRPLLAVVGEQALPEKKRWLPGSLPLECAIPLTPHAGFDELCSYVQAAAPQRVLLHRGQVHAFRRALQERGYEVELVLGPQQASLEEWPPSANPRAVE